MLLNTTAHPTAKQQYWLYHEILLTPLQLWNGKSCMKQQLIGFPSLLHQFSMVQPHCHFKPETRSKRYVSLYSHTLRTALCIEGKDFPEQAQGKNNCTGAARNIPGLSSSLLHRQEQSVLRARPLYTQHCWVKVISATETLLQLYGHIRDLSHAYYIMLCPSAKENKPLVYIQPLFCWTSEESALHMTFKNDVLETQWVPLWTNRCNSWDHMQINGG